MKGSRYAFLAHPCGSWFPFPIFLLAVVFFMMLGKRKRSHSKQQQLPNKLRKLQALVKISFTAFASLCVEKLTVFLFFILHHQKNDSDTPSLDFAVVQVRS
jgi:uncharacterized membrane protein YfcA